MKEAKKLAELMKKGKEVAKNDWIQRQRLLELSPFADLSDEKVIESLNLKKGSYIEQSDRIRCTPIAFAMIGACQDIAYTLRIVELYDDGEINDHELYEHFFFPEIPEFILNDVVKQQSMGRTTKTIMPYLNAL